MTPLDPGLVWAVRVAAAGVFAQAIWHKVADRAGFEGALAAYLADVPGVGPRSVGVAARLVLAAEMLAVLAALFAGAWATAPAASLLALYGLAMAFNIARGRRLLDCGCAWGSSRQEVTPILVARNAVLALAACAGSLPVVRASAPVDLVGALGGAALLLLAYAIANQLIANRQKLAETRP